MKAKPDVLMMTADAALLARVAGALVSNGHNVLPRSVRDVRELCAALQSSPVPFVLVDLDENPRRVLAELEPVSAMFPATRFIGLAQVIQADLLIEAMQVGLRQIILKERVGHDLEGVLNRLTAAMPMVADLRGEVVTVLSAGGGCGATTLAVNLARELAEESRSPSLLIDLDTAYGAAANYIGLEAEFGIADVLGCDREIDPHLIRTTAAVYDDRLHLLASPATANFASPTALDFNRLGAALRSCRQAYRATVLDAPRVPMHVAAALAAASDRTVLMFQLTVKDVRVARQMVEGLAVHGISRESLSFIASRWARWGQMVTLDEARRALGGGEIGCVRNDYKSASRCMTAGQPLAQAAPRSSLRSDLQSLAARMKPVAWTVGGKP